MSPSVGSGTIGAGTGLAARIGVRGGSPGIDGWNWAPLARRAEGADWSSSVTDLMNASSSSAVTRSGCACGRGGGGAGAAVFGGGVGRWLAPQVTLFLYRLAGAFGVGLELLGDGREPRLVIGANPGPHVPRRRVRRVVQARDPGFVLAPLFQQALDDDGALERSFRHAANLANNRPSPVSQNQSWRCTAHLVHERAPDQREHRPTGERAPGER